MKRAAIAATLAVAGCSDPTLRIDVVPPASFAATSIRIHAYQSETTCDQVEYGHATLDTLASEQIDEAEATAGEVLIGVPRTGPKLIVAQGLVGAGEDAQAIYAGCAELDEIGGDVVVTVTGVALAALTVVGDALDQPFAQRQIAVAAVDAHGDAIDQRPLRWESYGVAGTFGGDGVTTSTEPATPGAPVPALCIKRGVAHIKPRDPDVPGPIAAQIRVRWADATPPPLSGFVEGVPYVAQLDEGSASRVAPSCTVRRIGGADQVWCLTRPPAPGGPRQVVRLSLVGGVLLLDRSATEATLSDVLVATDHDNDGNDDLFVVEQMGQDRVRWNTIDGDNLLGGTTTCPGGCQIVAIRGVAIVPACGTEPGFAVVGLATSLGPAVVYTTLRGDPLPSPPIDPGPVGDVELGPGGCVADSTAAGAHHGVFVTRRMVGGFGVNELWGQCGGECSARWTGLGAVGFSGGDRPRLISSDVDITGNVIVESEIALVAGGTALALIEKQRTATSAQARAIAAGDMDGDGNQDLAWVHSFTDDTGMTANRIQIAVGIILPFAGRLTGLSPGRTGLQPLILFARVDGDPLDDVVTFSDREAAVFLSGEAVAPGPTVGVETTCD